MDFFEEMKRITRAHCELMGYPVPSFKPALGDVKLVPHRCRVEGDIEIERGRPCNWCGAFEPDFAIPASILKPTSGPCVHCHQDTEDRHGGEWMHDECNDVLVAEQQADYRADDPRHGQASDLNRKR